jgi:cation diffusion facilitator CzcD-associated flavoprotein CzcO
MQTYDVIVIGGGQSALSVGYYLRRAGLSYLMLDKETAAGGSWQHYWQSLRLFSPATFSSLPGTLMPGGADYYPSREDTLEYLRNYEEKYQLPIQRNTSVENVEKKEDLFHLTTNQGTYRAKAVVSATGSFARPFVPEIKGLEKFGGKILHSSAYYSAEPFTDQEVLVVGEGNSGAQILAEVSEVAQTTWITSKEAFFQKIDRYIMGRR